MKVDIKEERVIFDEFFKVKKAKLQFEKFDGTMSNEVVRYSYEKNNAVAALLYHREKDAVVLVNQHRYPPMSHGLDWIVEVVAGGLKPGEDPENAIKREIMEETGFEVESVKMTHDCYVSPGVFTERLKLYYAVVTDAHQTNNGGGLLDEDEDIELIFIPSDKVLDVLNSGEIIDAKTLVGLYYFLSNHR